MNDQELINARKFVAEILQQMLEGKLTPEEARTNFPLYKGDPSLDSALHILYHFEDDEDIRIKDQKYANWQVEQIKKIILCFKHGQTLDDSLIEWLTPKSM